MTASETLLKSIIQRIATGPDLSKDISLEEAQAGMEAIIKGEIDPVQSAIFFIALRMKRETMAENKGILTAILAQSEQQHASVDCVVDLGDPYSGYDRNIPISSFLPPLLAELGLPCVIHGLNSVSPKFGLTHAHVYQAMGLATNLSTKQAKNRIEDNATAWTYIDQAQYCPGLHDLVALRDKVIKRTVINTVETLIAPIRGRQTHAVLGYVHKPYPPIYAELATTSGLDSSLLVRGVEGGVVPSLRQTGLMISYDGNNERESMAINPKDMGIEQSIRGIALPEGLNVQNNLSELAKHTADLGHSALSGKTGAYYDGLVYSASLILWHMKKADSLLEASEMARNALDSGKISNRLPGKG